MPQNDEILRDLGGHVAVVTGASSGLGRAIAKQLAMAGAKVVVNHPPNAKSAAKGESVVKEIAAAGGVAVAIGADVAAEDQIEGLFAKVIAEFGTVHIVVANAGIERSAPIEKMTLEQWRSVIDVNLTGAFLTARAAVREFLRRGPIAEMSPATGKIVFTSSVHEIIPWSFQVNYAASKGGLSMLMRSLAQELAPRKIRVNSVAPGAIRTPINIDAWQTEAAMKKLLELIPYGRIGEPEDIAKAVHWLVSDASDYVNGTALVVDGGMTLFPSFRDAG